MKKLDISQTSPKTRRFPTFYSSLAPARVTEVFDTYWKFAAERQKVFFRRIEEHPSPYTDDPIMQVYKFTNAYRASDRTSQYLIKNVIYGGDQTPEELFFRIILFKIFNKIDTWRMLLSRFEVISYSEYNFADYDRVLTESIEKGQKIFSNAYIMPTGRQELASQRKHRTFLLLLELMMKKEVPRRLAEARSMKQAFDLLRSFPLIGNFLAYQYCTDINYSSLVNFSEMEFVIPGPGAKDGIRKCFSDLGGLNESDIIRMMADRQEVEFKRLGIDFRSLWGRKLQLIDCQNLFCEVDKYARVFHPTVQGISRRTKIKQFFRQSDTPIDYWYPPKWKINGSIKLGTLESSKDCNS